MATFEVQGLTDLVVSFEKMASIPDRILENILTEQSEVVIREMKAQVPKNTGKLAASIKKNRFKRTKDGAHIDIYPQGTHHVSKSSRYRSSSGGSRVVRNAEVGFIHEYGAPRRGIPARQWMRTAGEKSTEEITRIGQKIYESYVDSLY
jgi:hypothetical protein